MNTTTNTIRPENGWAMEPEAVPAEGPGRSASDLERWRQLRPAVREMALRRGWSKAEVAKRSGVAEGTFSQWYSGKYVARFDGTNQAIGDWLVSEEASAELIAALPVSPGFIETRASTELWDLMMAAQMLPSMTMACMGAGIGKTTTAERFVEKNANCWLVTVSASTMRPHTLLQQIAEALEIATNNPSRLISAIGKKVARRGKGTLLIIDEAQGLTDEAVNQLRQLLDLYKCGICLVGNDESYKRFSAWHGVEKYGQLRRRILKRVRRIKADEADLVSFIRAWGVQDEAMTRFLVGVGMKPGALGQIDNTIKLAKLGIAGTGKPLTLALLKDAWTARDVEA